MALALAAECLVLAFVHLQPVHSITWPIYIGWF